MGPIQTPTRHLKFGMWVPIFAGPGSIATEQDGDDLFLLLHGKRVAKRGRPGTRKASKWIPIVSWIDSVVDESDSSVIIRYAKDKAVWA